MPEQENIIDDELSQLDILSEKSTITLQKWYELVGKTNNNKQLICSQDDINEVEIEYILWLSD